MKSPLLVSTNTDHDFTLAKNIMAKTQLVKIVNKIPDKIVPSSNILLNIIDTKVVAAYPKEETVFKFFIALAIVRITLFVYKCLPRREKYLEIFNFGKKP